MDFGDFITLILFLVFFLSPFLKIKKTKKAQKPGESTQSGFSVLGKIREALKEAAREMQAQAEQARKKEVSGQSKRAREPKGSLFNRAGEESVDQTFWDKIDDRTDSDFYPDGAKVQVLEQIEPVTEKPLFISTKKRTPQKSRQDTGNKAFKTCNSKIF